MGSALALATAAVPAHAVPVGDPFEPIGLGLEPDLAFNAIDARYLLAVWSPGRGGFSSAVAVSLAAAGDPDVRGAGVAGPTAVRAQIAHDSRRNRSLLAFVQTGARPESPQSGVTVALFAHDGTRLAGPTVIAATSEPPQVAYNSRSGEYMVVYGGTAQRISGDGVPVGAPRPLSLNGTPSDIAYRRRANDFLVISSSGQLARIGADGTQLAPAKGFGPEVGLGVAAIAVEPGRLRALITFPWESRIYARSVVGRNATPTGMRQIARAGRDTAVAYNPVSDEYLALWTAPPAVAGGLTTIHGQHLTRRLREIGPDDFRVSSPTAPPTVPQRNEFAPAVAADTGSSGYLAAWNVEFDPIFGFYRVVARRMISQR